MDDRQRSEIARVVPSILGQLAFLFADPAEAGDFAGAEGTFLAGSLTFNGPSRGGMTAAMPEAMALELAANLLGTEMDDPKAKEFAHDALGEFLNVACGHVLTSLHGSGPVFLLSAPNLFGLTAPETGLLAGKQGALTFSVDGAPFLFQASFSGCSDSGSGDGHA